MGQSIKILPITERFINEYYRLKRAGKLPPNVELAAIMEIKTPSTISNILVRKQNIKPEAWELFRNKFRISEAEGNGQPTPDTPLTGAHVTLQDYIDDLRRDKETLYALANSILDQIKLDTKTALAYQMAWVEYEAERAAKGDEQLKLELIHRMNTLVRSYLPGRAAVSNESEIGKQGKG